MRIRSKLALILSGLSVLPLAAIGFITFQRARQALRESLGASFRRMAAETMDKVDRSLYEVQQQTLIWSRLGLMQEVLTGDLDGRISSFLMSVSREYRYFSSLEVMDGRGEVVAASHAHFIGRATGREQAFERVVRGEPYLGDIDSDPLTGNSVVTFGWPIRAQFDENRTVGVLCVKWNAGELYGMTQALERHESQQSGTLTVLLRADGRTISLPALAETRRGPAELLAGSWTRALLSRPKGDGYEVETTPGDEAYLVGYSHSRGFRDFPGFGWVALVIQDIDSAFAPIGRLQFILLIASSLVVLIAAGFSLVISQRIADPLVRMARVAQHVARGDFEAQVDYRSGDEVGALADALNRMIGDLKSQRARLVEKDYVDSILSNMSGTLLVVDPTGRIRTANRAALDLLGYREEELLGCPLERVLTGEDPRFAPSELARRLAEAPLRDIDLTYLTRAGKRIPVAFSASVLLGNDGKTEALLCLASDITERKQAEERIRAALGEKEALLKEIHHRVKNDLQVIISLLRLQADHIQDPRALHVFKDSENRIKSMALLHEKLYRSENISQINAEDYFRALTRDLLNSYPLSAAGVEVRVEAGEVILGMETAIHCGLIVNELISNALKYAFPDGRRGQIDVGLAREPSGRFLLRVRDNGIGLPADFDFRKTETLGLQLVCALADHLEGSVEVASQGGTEFRLRLKDIDAEATVTPIA